MNEVVGRADQLGDGDFVALGQHLQADGVEHDGDHDHAERDGE